MSVQLENGELRDLILSIGTHQGDRRLSPLEVARLLQKAVAAGSTRAELAEALRLQGTTMIGRFLRLLKLDNQIADMVDWGAAPGRLSLTQAQEIARVDSSHHPRLVDLALENDLSSGELRSVVQRMERAGETPEAATHSIVRMRPEIVRTRVVIGVVEDADLVAHLSSIGQRDRDIALVSALKSLGRSELSGKLTPHRFSVSGPYEDLKSLDADSFEAELTEELKQAVARPFGILSRGGR
jgi:hypothetical protein